MSPLQKARLKERPEIPKSQEVKREADLKVDPEIQKLFPLLSQNPTLSFQQPLTIGVVLSGGQAPGGHNVINGLFDALLELDPKSRLIGFLNGPSGLIKNQFKELSKEFVHSYLNQGGFDMIGSGRTKIEKEEDFKAVLATAKQHHLNGIVVIGGDDSNTNAALLAEYFLKQGEKIAVIGVPKTIDGDLKNRFIEASFGFDTAVKVYSESIGNILKDNLSAKKYYYFIKLMGRSASHIALECALQTHPNVTWISEEVEAQKRSIKSLVDELVEVIVKRAEMKKDFGVFLIPEGIVEFIPEFKTLMQELNQLLAKDTKQVASHLTPPSKACYLSLPESIQKQLIMDRDPHGNVQVSKIETERLFIELVEKELQKRSDYKGKFSPQPLFFGYEGRSALPSYFDAHYTYALGRVSALLLNSGATGLMATVSNLSKPVSEWQFHAAPLIQMMVLETRKGVLKPVIQKALVDLNSSLFKSFSSQREVWKIEDHYLCPGPIQFWGPKDIVEATTFTLN